MNKVVKTRTTDTIESETEKTEDCSEVNKTLECEFESKKENIEYNQSEEAEENLDFEIKANKGDTENKTVETVEIKSQSLDDIIRENSGLYCEYCPWGPAKTKKGIITHKAKMHSSLYFSKSKNRK